MRKLIVVVMLSICSYCMAQDFSNSWQGYFSYNSITALSEGENIIFAAAQNSVFSYNIVSNKINTYSTINGLTGGTISALHYSPTYNILLVGYASGIFDVLRLDDGEVLHVVDIKNKEIIPPDERSINQFYEREGTIYIATGFGISLYDLNRLEFDDTYFIGSNGSRLQVNQLAIAQDYIYAATENAGVLRALANESNLIDFNNWETIASGSWQGITNLDENIYAISQSTLQRLEGETFTILANYGRVPISIHASLSYITVSFSDQIVVYNTTGSEVQTIGLQPEYESLYNTAIVSETGTYIGTQSQGLLLGGLTNTSFLQILPDGPLRNDPFEIQALEDELWVVYGDYSESYNPFPLKQRGLSHLQDTTWVNISYEEAFSANNLVNISVNPQQSEQVFISSYNSGLLELQENVAVQIYDENDGLSDIAVNPGDVRINGTAFDTQGNLWMTNSQVEFALARKNGSEIQRFSIEPVAPDFAAVGGYSDLVIDRSNNVYFGSSNRGIFAYNSLNSQFARLSGEDDGANLPIDNISALALDLNGTLWIGTTRGLRILSGPSQVFENPDIDTRPIVILENDIPVELLNDQAIQTIAVDGNNNKWIGTVSSGAFYFSANGQETLLSFNESNSPLPSSTINDISIDPKNGTVYFATPQGLVSYAGRAVEAAENLDAARAFPNPVRPGYTGVVTIDGLTDNANVKITDVTGNLVYEQVSVGGSIQWDTTAFGRHRVATGVYFIMITGENAEETKVTKLMIIR